MSALFEIIFTKFRSDDNGEEERTHFCGTTEYTGFAILGASPLYFTELTCAFVGTTAPVRFESFSST